MSEQPADDSNRQWHLDKRVSLTLITGVAANLVLCLWFVFNLEGRVAHLESQRVTDSRVVVLEQSLWIINRDIERLESRTLNSLDAIKNQLQRIEEKVIK